MIFPTFQHSFPLLFLFLHLKCISASLTNHKGCGSMTNKIRRLFVLTSQSVENPNSWFFTRKKAPRNPFIKYDSSRWNFEGKPEKAENNTLTLESHDVQDVMIWPRIHVKHNYACFSIMRLSKTKLNTEFQQLHHRATSVNRQNSNATTVSNACLPRSTATERMIAEMEAMRFFFLFFLHNVLLGDLLFHESLELYSNTF